MYHDCDRYPQTRARISLFRQLQVPLQQVYLECLRSTLSCDRILERVVIILLCWSYVTIAAPLPLFGWRYQQKFTETDS